MGSRAIAKGGPGAEKMARIGRKLAGIGLGAVTAAIFALSPASPARASVCPSGATVYEISDRNSTACVDVGSSSQSGMFNWYVDGADQIAKQWFWYRIGASGPEQSIDTLGAPVVATSDTNLDGVLDRLLHRAA